MIEPKVLAAARQIGHEEVEHVKILTPEGRLLELGVGSQNRFVLNAQQVGLLRGAVLIHNHPLGLPPSPADMAVCMRYGARALVVSGPRKLPTDGSIVLYCVVLGAVSGLNPRQIALGLAERIHRRARELEPVLLEGALTADEVEYLAQHQAWLDIGKEFPDAFTYHRIDAD